jgi:hypothetical protein
MEGYGRRYVRSEKLTEPFSKSVVKIDVTTE